MRLCLVNFWQCMTHSKDSLSVYYYDDDEDVTSMLGQRRVIETSTYQKAEDLDKLRGRGDTF